MGILDRLFGSQEKVIFIERNGKVRIKKLQRDETGAFIIKGHKYYPIKDRTTHLFIEGYSNEVQSIELIEGDKVKLVGTEDLEMIVQSEVLQQLASGRSKWFEKLQTNQYIILIIAIFSIVFSVFLYYKIQSLEQTINQIYAALNQMNNALNGLQNSIGQSNPITSPKLP